MSERAITILHLSDLQFGQHHRFERSGETGSLLDRLSDARSRIEAGGRPDLIVLTGDLAERGTGPEFEEVRLFAEGLLDFFALPRRRLVMVPGNHDINWRLSRNYFGECEEVRREPKRPYWPKLQYYAELFSGFYAGEEDLRFDEEQPWTLHAYEDLKVVVAGLNSTIAESHRQEDHYGFLGEEQIRAFARLLAPYKDRGWLRIGTVHHNVLHPESPAAEQDRDDFCAMLGPYLNLVLHGHIHRERIGWYDGDGVQVPVLGIGSTGVKAPQRVPEVGNQYQLVRIYQDRFRCEAERYEPDQKRWVADARIDRGGRSGVLERPVLFVGVDATFTAPASDQAAGAAALTAAVARYRAQVVLDRRTTLSEPMGFGGEHRAVDFLDLFVVPRARPTPPEPLPMRGLEEVEERVCGLELEQQREERFQPPLDPVQDLDRLLASRSEPWLLVLGAPGSGKTALTRWLMLSLCEPSRRLAGLPEDLVPLRIEMRRFDDAYRRASKRPYDFFAFLADEQAELSVALGDEHLRELARAGRLLWIFDGLDEVTDPGQRRRYTEMIAGLRSAHPGSRGLVTSRILGLSGADEVLRAAGVQVYTLLPFDERQVEELLDCWHAAMFAGAAEVGRRRRERLRAALRDAPSLRRLCESPLLATMVAYLNRDEDLPRRRHQLYQKVIERMADAWDAAKGLPGAPGQRHFPLDHKLRFLRRLAWQMLEEEDSAANVVHEDALIRFASRFCEETYDEEPDTARRSAEQLVQHLCERNHVLVPLGARLFGFVHRTFLEHLAAADVYVRYRGPRPTLILEEVGDVFRRRWQEERWQETLMLLCGLLDDRGRLEDVVAALQRIASRPGPEWQVDRDLDDHMVFVVRALAEVEQLEREPVRMFISRWMDLLEHRRTMPQPFPWDRLAAAFRLHEGRWPALEKLWALLRKEVHHPEQPTDFDWYMRDECVIAAGGKRCRVPLLLEAMAKFVQYRFYFFPAVAALGEWSDQEVETICTAVSDLDEHVKLDVVRAVLSSHSRHHAVNAKVAGLLGDLLRSANRDDVRYAAAKMLLRIDEHISLGIAALREVFLRGNHWFRGCAAADLALLGMVDEVLPTLVEMSSSHQVCMEVLGRLAINDPILRCLFDDALNRLLSIEDDMNFRNTVVGVARSGIKVANESALLSRLERVRESVVRYLAAVDLVDSSNLSDVGLRVLTKIYNSGEGGLRETVWRCLESKVNTHPGVDSFFLRVMDSDPEPGNRMLAACIIGGRSDNAVVHERALSILRASIGPDAPDTTRYLAARILRGPEGFEALQELARSARDESIRTRAAEAVSDRATLLDIAANAHDEQLRRMASADLRTLQHLRALLQVGHPRRARVRLDGQPVGILEERPTGGYLFTYDPVYVTPEAIPVSLTMPVRSAPYPSPTLHPFFENLLPEGWLLNQISATQGIASTDAFGLLLATGADCAGAVEVVPVEAEQP